METINTADIIEKKLKSAQKWELDGYSDLKTFLEDNSLYDEYIEEMRKEPNWVGKIAKVLYNLAQKINIDEEYKNEKSTLLSIKVSSLQKLQDDLDA